MIKRSTKDDVVHEANRIASFLGQLFVSDLTDHHAFVRSSPVFSLCPAHLLPTFEQRMYRDEIQREDAYAVHLKAKSMVASVGDEEGGLGSQIPVPTIERHPLHALYWHLIHSSNEDSRVKSLARNKMKRFVLDVHELWMTNLGHLREFSDDPDLLFDDEESDADEDELEDDSDGEDAIDPLDASSVHSQTSLTKHQSSSSSSSSSTQQKFKRPRLKGLSGRRDVDAIEGYSSQIPSVSTMRALKDVLIPPSQHVLDSTMKPPDLSYRPGQAARLKPPPRVSIFVFLLLNLNLCGELIHCCLADLLDDVIHVYLPSMFHFRICLLPSVTSY